LISGMLAGRSCCLWHTQVVIPMTLAPETGEVSWDSMGLRCVLFLTEVHSHLSKYQGFISDWRIVKFKNYRASPAVSGCAGSWTEPTQSYLAAASLCQAPWNLSLSKSGPGRQLPACHSEMSHQLQSYNTLHRL
jgi:hypothetical protein